MKLIFVTIKLLLTWYMVFAPHNSSIYPLFYRIYYFNKCHWQLKHIDTLYFHLLGVQKYCLFLNVNSLHGICLISIFAMDILNYRRDADNIIIKIMFFVAIITKVIAKQGCLFHPVLVETREPYFHQVCGTIKCWWWPKNILILSFFRFFGVVGY